jgi:hypothetical protein
VAGNVAILVARHDLGFATVEGSTEALSIYGAPRDRRPVRRTISVYVHDFGSYPGTPCLVLRQPGDGGRQLFLGLDADDPRRRRLRLPRPVFSSGIYLATKSVLLGADAVETHLDEPGDANAAPLRPADPAGLPNASAGSVPRSPAGDPRHFMAPRKQQRLEEAVLSVPADDVFGGSKIGQQFGRVQGSLLHPDLFHRACDFISGLAGTQRRARRGRLGLLRTAGRLIAGRDTIRPESSARRLRSHSARSENRGC